MSDAKKETSRRGFFLGLLAGAGAVLAAGSKRAEASSATSASNTPDPVLYRRTREAERYYKTLYS